MMTFFQSATFFIARRYWQGQSSDRFGRLVAWLSTIGIVLGVMALITVLSVMNGFAQQLEKNLLALMPQAVLTADNQTSLAPQQYSLQTLKQLAGVVDVAPLVESDVIIQSTHGIAMTHLLGITPEQREPLIDYLQQGQQQQLQPGQYNLIIGQALLDQLGLQVGETLRVMIPTVSQFTPLGRLPSQRLFTVIGTFRANNQIDSGFALVNQQDLARLLHYPSGNITGWRLWLQQPLAVSQWADQPLPVGLQWQDWRSQKGELFQAVAMEKKMMGLLLSLIIAVAGFNILTSLGLLVMEKQHEVAILQTQGMRPSQIMTIFMLQGVAVGIVGAIIGSLLGMALSEALAHLPGMARLLANIPLPIAIKPMQVIMVTIIAILMALVATLYPAWKAAKVKPAEALRYE